MNEKIDNFNYDFLCLEITKKIIIQPSKSFYGISFIGAPGVGKTTVANILSKRLGLFIASNDWIRRFLESMGIDPYKNQDLVAALAVYRTKYLLQNHMSMILDCNLLEDYEKAEYNFSQYHAPLFILYLKCDEKINLNRLEQRSKNQLEKDNYSDAGIDNYLCYKRKIESLKVPQNHIFYTINTGANLDAQLRRFETKLQSCLISF